MKPLLPPFSGYLLVAVVTSAPFLVKHLPVWFPVLITLYALLLVAGAIAVHALRPAYRSWLGHPLWWLGGVATLAAANMALYPSTRMGASLSTAPNALMEPAIAWLQHGLHPYAVRLFDGAPISPGPGWIILNAGFSLAGRIELLVPVYLALAALAVSRAANGAAPIFIGLLFGSLCFFQMSVTGHDLPATSLAMVALAITVYRWRAHSGVLCTAAVLAGLVATARAPFLIFPLALAVFLFPLDRRQSLTFGGTATVVAVGIHLLVGLTAHQQGLLYQPFHVFGRASGTGSPWMLAAGGLSVLAGLWILRHLKPTPESWLLTLWVLVGLPFALIGVGELLRSGALTPQAWALWEGKGYVMFTLPLLAASLAIRFARDGQPGATNGPDAQTVPGYNEASVPLS